MAMVAYLDTLHLIFTEILVSHRWCQVAADEVSLCRCSVFALAENAY